MALRLLTARDYEVYFERLAQSDFAAFHYLDADADAEMRCVFSPIVKLLCRMLPCLRRIFSTPIETRITLIHGRIQAYQRLSDKTAAGQKNIWHAADKLNDLLDRIDAKRALRHEPRIPKEMRFQPLVLHTIWDKANVLEKARGGDPAAAALLASARLVPSSQSTLSTSQPICGDSSTLSSSIVSSISSPSVTSPAFTMPQLFGSQLGNFPLGNSQQKRP